MLSHMGFRDWPLASFAAHLVFELHRIDGRFYVKFIYNPTPAHIKSYDRYLSKTLPSGNAVIQWDSAPGGHEQLMPFEEFERILMVDRRSFKTEEEWKADGDTVKLSPGYKQDGAD